MVVLDATQVQEETDAEGHPGGQAEIQADSQVDGQPEPAEPDLVRTITIDFPDLCKLYAVLMLTRAADNRWRSGFRLMDISGDDQEVLIEDAPADRRGDDGYEDLEHAILDAVDRACEWLSGQSDVVAADAIDYLEEWAKELNEVTEAIFDDIALDEQDPLYDCQHPEQPQHAETLAAPPVSPVPPAPPADVALDGEALAEIREAREEVRRREADYLEAKERAKEAKQGWEASVADLTETIDRLTRPLPLFDRPAAALTSAETPVASDSASDSAAEPATVVGQWRTAGTCPRGGQHEPDEDGDCKHCREPGVGTPATQAPATEPDESWKFVRIETLGLPQSLQDKLTDASVCTIGALEQLRADIAEDRAKWPKGIGEAKITRIENAVLDWLGKNRDKAVLEAAKA